MNPFKNISIFRDQDIYSDCNLRPWSYENAGSQWPLSTTKTTEFPEKQEWDTEYSRYKELSDKLKGNTDYAESQLDEIIILKKKEEVLQQENNRLSHLTTVLIDHIWKKHPFPLKEIDERMAEYDKKQTQFDDGGIDGTPRNA